MIAMMKVAGLSALLSAGFVTAYEAPLAPATQASGKIFVERLGDVAARPIVLAGAEVTLPTVVRTGKGDAAKTSTAATDPCAGQAWPYMSDACMAAANGTSRKIARTIAIDARR